MVDGKGHVRVAENVSETRGKFVRVTDEVSENQGKISEAIKRNDKALERLMESANELIVRLIPVRMGESDEGGLAVAPHTGSQVELMLFDQYDGMVEITNRIERVLVDLRL